MSKTPLRAPHLSALVAAPPGQMPPCRERGVFFGVAVDVGWRGSCVCLDMTNDRNMAKTCKNNAKRDGGVACVLH